MPESIIMRHNLVGMDRQRYHYVHQPESRPLEGKSRPQSTPMSLNRSEIGQAEIRLGKMAGSTCMEWLGIMP
ncbi:MAG: hypothetical protein ACJA1W_002125 [Akkermansiaceae bacterium]|jgi:hypothetical protein